MPPIRSISKAGKLVLSRAPTRTLDKSKRGGGIKVKFSFLSFFDTSPHRRRQLPNNLENTMSCLSNGNQVHRPRGERNEGWNGRNEIGCIPRSSDPAVLHTSSSPSHDFWKKRIDCFLLLSLLGSQARKEGRPYWVWAPEGEILIG